MDIYHVQLQLTEPLLGTVPKNPTVYKDFILKKALDLGVIDAEKAEEEEQTVAKLEEKGWTGFHADEDGPFLYDYTIKGFLCESARTMGTWGALKQLKDKFKRTCFVRPRRIRLPQTLAEPLERPLRAQTAQGPRVTLTRSDVIASGAKLDFELHVMPIGGIKKKTIEEVLAYGQYLGLGQWRTGSYGQFEVTKLELIDD